MSLFILLNIVSLFRTIIVLIVIYYGIKLFVRLVLPMLVEKGVKNMQQKMYDHHRQEQRKSRRDGEVIIENNRKSNKSTNPNFGEYVDFEEVD